MKNLSHLTNTILIASIKMVFSVALIATSTMVTTIAVTSTLAEYAQKLS